MTKYCPSCGKELKKMANFCHNCGHKLSEKTVKKKKPASKKVEKGDVWSKNTRIICGVMILLVVVLFLAFVGMIWINMNETLANPEFQRLYNISGSPFGEECNTSDDCVCMDEQNLFCQPAFFEWDCVDGMCEAEEKDWE